MPRKPRMDFGGCSYHLIQRGNNHQNCFFNDNDRNFYLTSLQIAAEQYHVDIHAYVLMTNHVHMLVTPRKDGATSLLMQSIGRRYVRYINDNYQRTGTLWEGRFKSIHIDCEKQMLACQRYIELNPVRAGIVEHYNQYAWSSARHHAMGETNLLLVDHPSYLALGVNMEKRAQAYRLLFCED